MSQYVVVTPEGKRFGPTDFRTLAQWASDGRVAPGMTVEDLLSGQTMTAAAVPGLFAPDEPAEPRMSAHEAGQTASRAMGIVSFMLGVLGLTAWCIPLFGFPVGMLAVFFGIRSRQSETRVFALIGLSLGILCLILSLAWLILANVLAEKLGLQK